MFVTAFHAPAIENTHTHTERRRSYFAITAKGGRRRSRTIYIGCARMFTLATTSGYKIVTSYKFEISAAVGSYTRSGTTRTVVETKHRVYSGYIGYTFYEGKRGGGAKSTIS